MWSDDTFILLLSIAAPLHFFALAIYLENRFNWFPLLLPGVYI